LALCFEFEKSQSTEDRSSGKHLYTGKKYLTLGERTVLKQTGSDYTQLTLLELAINTKNLSLVRGQVTSAVKLNPQYGHVILKVRYLVLTIKTMLNISLLLNSCLL